MFGWMRPPTENGGQIFIQATTRTGIYGKKATANSQFGRSPNETPTETIVWQNLQRSPETASAHSQERAQKSIFTLTYLAGNSCLSVSFNLAHVRDRERQVEGSRSTPHHHLGFQKRHQIVQARSHIWMSRA